MRLQVINGNSTYYWSVTNVAPAKPYLQISNQYLPLTTATTTGVKFKVQSGNTSYRAAIYNSGTYKTTSTAVGNLSSTTALTKASTVTYTTTHVSISSTYDNVNMNVTTANIRSFTGNLGTYVEFLQYTCNNMASYKKSIINLSQNYFSVSNTGNYAGIDSTTPRVWRSYSSLWYFYLYTYKATGTGSVGSISRRTSQSDEQPIYPTNSWQVFYKNHSFSGTNLTNPISSLQGGSADFASYTTNSTKYTNSTITNVYFSMMNFSSKVSVISYTNSTTTYTYSAPGLTSRINETDGNFKSMTNSKYSYVSVTMVSLRGSGAMITINTNSTKPMTTAYSGVSSSSGWK